LTAVALAPFVQLETNGGLPLSGGKVFTYQAGTLNPLATYTDRNAGTPNANPVVLDSAGRAHIWLQVNVAYKIIVEDSAGNVIDSVDNYYAGADPAQLTAAGIVPATGGTYTGLVSFTGGATFDGTAAQDLATLDSLNIAAVQNANLWINSDFRIAQRGLGSFADALYSFDRTRVLCDGGSVTTSTFDPAVNGLPNAGRIQQPDVAAKRMGIVQIVENKDCVPYRGKNLALGLKVRCSASTTIRCALVAWTGAADSPTGDVVNNWASTTYTAGNFFVANTSTIAVTATAVTAATWTDVLVSSASAGGVVAPSTMTNLYMVIWTDATVAQNVTLDFANASCGQGTVTPLWTPPNSQQEFAKCQRYLEIGSTQLAGYNTAGAVLAIRVPFAVVKRAVPSVGLSGAGGFNNTGTVGDGATTESFRFTYTATATGAASANATWTCAAEL